MNQKEAQKYLKDNQNSVLEKCGKLLGREISIQSFNGLIGGKNKVYNVDAVNYKTPEEYIDAWKKSQKEIKARDNADYDNSIKRIDLLLKDKEISNYVNAFLTRTYYKRTKTK